MERNHTTRANLLKKILQACLVSLFVVYVILPAVLPTNTSAESSRSAKTKLERRASAKQRSAARLLQRVMNGEDISSEDKTRAMSLASARCSTPAKTFPCGDGNGGTVTVKAASDCGKCQGGGAFSCESCCDAMAGSNKQVCKDAAC